MPAEPESAACCGHSQRANGKVREGTCSRPDLLESDSRSGRNIFWAGTTLPAVLLTLILVGMIALGAVLAARAWDHDEIRTPLYDMGNPPADGGRMHKSPQSARRACVTPSAGHSQERQ
jgi:hypothetical protein